MLDYFDETWLFKEPPTKHFQIGDLKLIFPINELKYRSTQHEPASNATSLRGSVVHY